MGTGREWVEKWRGEVGTKKEWGRNWERRGWELGEKGMRTGREGDGN